MVRNVIRCSQFDNSFSTIDLDMGSQLNDSIRLRIR